MNVIETAGTKVYRIAPEKSLPDWLAEKRKRSLKGNSEFQQRVELLQDFEFPTAAQRLRVTPDGSCVLGVGMYKPVIRCWEVDELSMKWERFLDCEATDFAILSDDWRKLVILQANRVVEFHTGGGIYYQTRVPRTCWALTYDRSSCDVVMVGSSSEVYRLNLEQGRFLEPFQSAATGLNVCTQNEVFPLLATGATNGLVECWDPRARRRAAMLSVNPLLAARSGAGDGKEKWEVTALTFSKSGMEMLAGTSGGHSLLFDIRAKEPVLIKEHPYGTPIRFLQFHGRDTVLSADTKVIKAFHRGTGATWLNLETPSDINHALVYPDSGILCVACEQPKVESYYIPALGVAPRWCNFLDNLTEELEQSTQPVIYDDFKFVTKEEVKKLGMERLVGKECLRAYMHGYFMDIRLYKKIHAIVDPDAYEKYRKERIREKVESERQSRISVKRKAPKVNKELFLQRLRQDKQELADAQARANNERTAAKPPKVKAGDILQDDRFSAMFENPEFEIDTESLDYKMKYKHSNPGDDPTLALEDDDQYSDDDGRGNSPPPAAKPTAGRGLKMFTLTDEKDQASVVDEHVGVAREPTAEVHSQAVRKRKAKQMTFGERLEDGEAVASAPSLGSRFGAKEMVFTPEKKKRRAEARTPAPVKRQRRSARGLR